MLCSTAPRFRWHFALRHWRPPQFRPYSNQYIDLKVDGERRAQTVATAGVTIASEPPSCFEMLSARSNLGQKECQSPRTFRRSAAQVLTAQCIALNVLFVTVTAVRTRRSSFPVYSAELPQQQDHDLFQVVSHDTFTLLDVFAHPPRRDYLSADLSWCHGGTTHSSS